MQNIHKEIEEKADSNQYRRRHDYSHIETVIDGVTYKILSVSPRADEGYKPQKVSELFAYLINGR